jgi:hypothetical protein
MAPDCFENAYDIYGLFPMNTGQYTAAINEYRGSVEPGNGHHAAGHVFVASPDGNEAVHAFASHDCFDTVGNDFTGN